MSKDQFSSPPGDALPILGIDVSKLTLDTCLALEGKLVRQRVANTAEGHRQMLEALQKHGVSTALIVMEATGPYHLALATTAFEAGHRVAVINPRRVLDYAKAKGRRNKTDRVDAAIIASFASAHAPALWQPLPAAQNVLRELLRRQGDLEAYLQAEERRLEMAPSVPALRESLRRAIRWIQAEKLRMEKSVVRHLQEEPALADDIRRLEAIPGFGEKTARLLTAEIPRHFKNARAVAAWLSVVPQQWTSGTSVRNGSHLGFPAPSLRGKLYFPAISAMRWDARSKAFAERLRAAGKAKMSIIFAVLHKLVRAAFAILKTGSEYQPTHAVKLDAPCSP